MFKCYPKYIFAMRARRGAWLGFRNTLFAAVRLAAGRLDGAAAGRFIRLQCRPKCAKEDPKRMWANATVIATYFMTWTPMAWTQLNKGMARVWLTCSTYKGLRVVTRV